MVNLFYKVALLPDVPLDLEEAYYPGSLSLRTVTQEVWVRKAYKSIRAINKEVDFSKYIKLSFHQFKNYTIGSSSHKILKDMFLCYSKTPGLEDSINKYF